MTREQYERRARLWRRLADQLADRACNAIECWRQAAREYRISHAMNDACHLAARRRAALDRADECFFMATSELVEERPDGTVTV